jgi:protein involved in polysaccharide export with SLBB domain
MIKFFLVFLIVCINFANAKELTLQELQEIAILKQKMEASNNSNSLSENNDADAPIENNIDINSSKDEEIELFELEMNEDVKVKRNPFTYETKEIILGETYSKQLEIETKKLEKYGSNFTTNHNSINTNNTLISNSYKINIGDVLSLIIYGVNNDNYLLEVDKKGNVHLPEIGPLHIHNINYKDVVEVITEKLKKSFKNSKFYVTLDSTSPIQVTITGEVNAPGIYNIGSQSTIKEILIASSGISKSGSFRDIKIIRNGKKIVSIDVYKLIKEGDNSYLDYILRDGDTVLIPAIKKEIRLEGEVYTSAIYDLKADENLEKLLYYASGIKASANKMDIKIKRFVDNEQISIINLKSVQDYKLQNGDVVTVFPISDIKTSSIFLRGNVVNPTQKSYVEGLSLYDFLNNMIVDNTYNGVFLENTNMEYALIKRIDKKTLAQTIISFNINSILNRDEGISLEAGDEVFIFNKTELQENPYIYVTGDVVQEQHKYQFFEGLTLADAFNFTDFKSEFFVEDETGKQRRSIVISSRAKVTRTDNNNTEVFILDAKKDQKFSLLKYDEIEFFNQLDMMTEQFATIRGEVNFSGKFTIDSKTSINTLIKMAGGLKDKAYMSRFEIVRYSIEDGIRKQNIQSMSLSQALEDNIMIKKYDEVTVFKIPNWDETKIVTVSGEVKFPGEYVVSKTDTISDLLKRVGGYTDEAFVEGTFFSRESIKISEIKNRATAVKKLRKNATYIAISPTAAGETAQDKQNLMVMIDNLVIALNETEPLGRLSVNLSKNLENFSGSTFDVLLEDGDKIIVPTKNETIMVVGEVLNSNTFIYSPNESIEYYIEKSGGLTDKADYDNIYVVHANGDAERYESGYLFSSGNEISNGDTIVVSLKIETTSFINIAKDVTQIMYQLAITAASIYTVGGL